MCARSLKVERLLKDCQLYDQDQALEDVNSEAKPEGAKAVSRLVTTASTAKCTSVFLHKVNAIGTAKRCSSKMCFTASSRRRLTLNQTQWTRYWEDTAKPLVVTPVLRCKRTPLGKQACRLVVAILACPAGRSL